MLLFFAAVCSNRAGSLIGSYVEVPRGATVDLTAVGAIDWVHWGLLTDSTVVRKAGVSPQIGPLTTVGSTVSAYRYFDNFNGYSWSDGWPVAGVTNTTTGLWAFGNRQAGSGFELRLPASPSPSVVKVYVGVFGGVGQFSATLNDTNIANYSDATLTNLANGPGRVYTIEYASDSEEGMLVIRWTLAAAYDEVANVTVQAAALTATDANNPPVISIQAPDDSASAPAGRPLTIIADAFDVDGQIEKVEFRDGNSLLGEDFDAPYSYEWSEVPLGHHILTARAVDTLGGTRTSAAVEFFAHGSGGRLIATRTNGPAAVDLTTEGTLDWAHWGYPSNATFNHKATVDPKISDVMGLGEGDFLQYSNNFTAFSWSDGMPVSNAAGTTSGVYIGGWTNRFEVRVAAGTVIRRLRIYAGLYGAQGHFQAFLSDFSAPAYSDSTAFNMFGDSYDVYTIDFMAAAPGQTLIVRYRPRLFFDAQFGNITLQAATLRDRGPLIAYSFAPLAGLRLFFGTDLGGRYILESSESLNPPAWTDVTNVLGSGGIISISELGTNSQGFFRVRSEPLLPALGGNE